MQWHKMAGGRVGSLVYDTNTMHGYFLKGSKTRILVKQEVDKTAKAVFRGTEIDISTEGGR